MNHGANGHREFSTQEISRILGRYRSSGLGAMRFAQEEGIPPGRLHYWLYQKRRAKLRPLFRPSVSVPTFQEVKIAAAMVPGAGPWAAEVSLPRGLAVRFSSQATPEWMDAVVKLLEQPC
jgi:hypothetical protein